MPIVVSDNRIYACTHTYERAYVSEWVCVEMIHTRFYTRLVVTLLLSQRTHALNGSIVSQPASLAVLRAEPASQPADQLCAVLQQSQHQREHIKYQGNDSFAVAFVYLSWCCCCCCWYYYYYFCSGCSCFTRTRCYYYFSPGLLLHLICKYVCMCSAYTGMGFQRVACDWSVIYLQMYIHVRIYMYICMYKYAYVWQCELNFIHCSLIVVVAAAL